MTLEDYLNEHGSDHCTEPVPGYEDDWKDDLLDDEDYEEDEDDE